MIPNIFLTVGICEKMSASGHFGGRQKGQEIGADLFACLIYDLVFVVGDDECTALFQFYAVADFANARIIGIYFNDAEYLCVILLAANWPDHRKDGYFPAAEGLFQMRRNIDRLCLGQSLSVPAAFLITLEIFHFIRCPGIGIDILIIHDIDPQDFIAGQRHGGSKKITDRSADGQLFFRRAWGQFQAVQYVVIVIGSQCQTVQFIEIDVNVGTGLLNDLLGLGDRLPGYLPRISLVIQVLDSGYCGYMKKAYHSDKFCCEC